MATKTYMPTVKRRIIVRPNPVWGIVNYDIDNAYPQRVLELVRQSPTAKKCWDLKAKYIGGNGFQEKDLGKQVINSKGLTLAKLLNLIKVDRAIFPGFGIHVNYNANYKIVGVNFVKYEDIRQGDTDCEKYKGKYVIYKDWGRKTWRSIYMAKFDVLDAFNPDPKVIKEQVIAAGGWEFYKGQLFYLTPRIDDYDLSVFDPALEDVETESGIKIFNNRSVQTGFMPSAMLFMKARREDADEESPVDDGMLGYSRSNKPTSMEQNLATFQGAEEAQKIIVIEWEGEASDKPELSQYQIQNNDKLFEVTSQSVEANIIKVAGVPKELVSSESKNGLSNGDEKRGAIIEFNDNTAPDRQEVSEVLEMIFANFYTNINPKNNWTITEIPAEGSGETVIKYADKVQAIIESPRMTRDNKVNTLMIIYGFKQDEAEKMIPEDQFIKDAAPAPVASPPKTKDLQETNDKEAA